MALLRSVKDLRQVFLDEARAEMNIQLDEWLLANALEGVDLAGLDDEDVACPGLKLLSVDRPETAT
jgi:hypothetical protein